MGFLLPGSGRFFFALGSRIGEKDKYECDDD